MKKILYMLLATAFAISCSEFEIYDTPYPDSATINISAEWTTLHDGDTTPTQYAILNDGTEQKVSTQTTYIVDASADSDFLVYNLPSGITISNGVATLGDLTTNPEHLYYGKVSATLAADSEQDVTVATYRATAPLTLKLSYESSEVKNVTGVEVTLSGVVTSRNLWTGAALSCGTLTQSPTISDASSEVEITFNILGVDDSGSQILTLTFTTSDSQTIPVDSDLTSQLTSFNDNMSSLVLDGDLNIPTDLETSGITIGSWESSDAGLTGDAQ